MDVTMPIWRAVIGAMSATGIGVAAIPPQTTEQLFATRSLSRRWMCLIWAMRAISILASLGNSSSSAVTSCSMRQRLSARRLPSRFQLW